MTRSVIPLTSQENMIFLYHRKANDQNYPKSLFLNVFINVEISFLQIGSELSLLVIESGIFYSSGSNRVVASTEAKASN